MKKELRVTRNEEFGQIIHQGKIYSNACFVLYYSESKKEKARVGISVSKKLGNAPKRNKIKRQLRSMLDEEVNFAEPFDFIVIVKKMFLENDYQENKKQLNSLINKVYNR